MSIDTDYAPVGIIDDRDTLFTTLRNGDVAANLTAIDTGPLTGGRWVIDAQSHPGLFSVTYNPATDTSARLVVNNAAALPEAGLWATVTMHYYDRYQLDGNGNPMSGLGIQETLVYTVEQGATRDLAQFGSELSLGSAGAQANPTVATLADGGFVTVWQVPGTLASGLMAQVRDAAGNARGNAFALTSGADYAFEGEPAVAGLGDGRFVTAYTVLSGGTARVAYRVADAAGNLGPQVYADLGAGADTAMPDVAAMPGGGFAIAWRAGGEVHVRQADAAGVLGAEQIYNSLGSAYSPSIAASGGSYVVSWGEIGSGAVMAAVSGGAPVMVNGDGLAASISTGAPLPSVATLKDGSFVVAWSSYSNSAFGFGLSDIFFQRFDAAGNRVGDIVQANVESGGMRDEASVTALSDGSFVVAWQASSGDFDGNGVYGRRFGADGSAYDMREFAINELRPGDQANAALTALADGGFAAAWIDTQSNGAVTVEARVLAAAGAPVSATPAGWTAPSGTASSEGMGSSVATYGSDGANLIQAIGNQRIDAMGGLDTISFNGIKGAFSIQRGALETKVVDSSGTTATLVNAERLAFADSTVALDIEGNAGKAYRLYQAAFDRTPDKGGLGYWINALDSGKSLAQIAGGFTGSKEFADLYGSSTSNAEFISLLYDNVLHRAPDADGLNFWINAMIVHQAPREEILAQFSESAENQVQVIGAIQNGIEFVPYL
ncbi:DUF4214 domain-containing protein [Massilia sp. AB1]|uniref:DUF4214 domain-containing protein n=1 Tax=Massilia sp. AB1 TaxID=2823371 RepID=UPI001B82CB55|nr:DUF4214 domain-containing protein [Massilia sp. AB1]MBQ5942337.1 DUF4214 domain-containing protein [Massilia sp. AB1]